MVLPFLNLSRQGPSRGHPCSQWSCMWQRQVGCITSRAPSYLVFRPECSDSALSLTLYNELVQFPIEHEYNLPGSIAEACNFTEWMGPATQLFIWGNTRLSLTILLRVIRPDCWVIPAPYGSSSLPSSVTTILTNYTTFTETSSKWFVVLFNKLDQLSDIRSLDYKLR